MPADFIKDEHKWEKAKEIVQDEYQLSENDGDDYWALVMGVYKKMKGGFKHKHEGGISRLKGERRS